MNSFDVAITHFLNGFSRHSVLFDNMMVFFAGNNLLKGGVMASLVWWAWFNGEARRLHNRLVLASTLASCLVAMALARLLALSLPFRNRPMHEEGLGFLLPDGLKPETLDGWSSFPSDHATLFFCLATGLTFISRRLGIFALIYSFVVITFPRWYLGLHYPTDSIAGAVVGITIAILGNRYLLQTALLQKIVGWSETRASLFYPVFFLFTCQIVTMFTESRALARAALIVIHRLMG